MSKAEERAFERCPKSENVIEEMRNERKRAIFIEGYHQAEKDLELTWEDIYSIVDIDYVLEEEWLKNRKLRGIKHKDYYEEVLKRFKERK